MTAFLRFNLIIKINFFILCLLILPATLFSQQKIQRIKINWNFFKNNKPKAAAHSAYTSYNFNLNTKLSKVSGENLLLSFDVIFKLDTSKSYMDYKRKYKDKKLLNHEQGHADIGILYARKLVRLLSSATFFKTGYNNKIRSIFNENYALMIKKNLKYDMETQYGTDDDEQRKWDAYLKTNL